MKVYQAMAKAVASEGVRCGFSLMGDTNMAFLASLDYVEGVRVHESRHEGSAVTMAEGYARASGNVGLASVTAGPGLANTLMPLTSAVRARAPMVLQTGQHSRDDITHSQWMSHEAFAALAGAAYVPVAQPEAILPGLRTAFYRARALQIPVVFDVPMDLQNAELPGAFDYLASTTDVIGQQRVRPAQDALEQAADALADAARPIIVVGRGAVDPYALDQVQALADRVGALLITTLEARAVLGDNPWSIGVLGIFTFPLAVRLLKQADLIVSFGASLNHYTIQRGTLFPQARLLQVDIKSNHLNGNGRAAEFYLQADAGAGAAALVEAMRARAHRTSGFRSAELARELSEDLVCDPGPGPADGLADPREVVTALDRKLPSDCGLVVGVGHYWAFPIMHMLRPRTPFMLPHHFAAIGNGLPLAVGAALADRERPLCLVEGDGSMMMHIHALETAAHHQLPMLVVVLDDAALGAEYHKLRVKGFSPRLSVGPGTSFAEVGRSMGCRGVEAVSPAEVAAATEEFLADRSGPMVIDVRISRDVVTIPYRRQHFGEDI